ncbi:MAG: TetR/AcrR family transcriptional regulator [Deltaproteobacteria bacterium]|nr:MAG: TetR/AcrR family transcriptional regulator [Deltaproteobacteria bacterium]
MRVPRSTDRRVVRTREALRDALIALMVERGWDEVGIRDVCARASVGRSTFYTHFADKEELLLSGYDDLRRMLRSVGRGDSRKPLAFTRGLFEHAHDNKRMFRALVGKRSS